MIADLLIIADSVAKETHGKQGESMRVALEGGAHGGGAEEAVRFFGEHLAGVKRVSGTAIDAIDEMLVGFKSWLALTGYADDKFMMLALMDIASGLAKYRRPSDARIRPSIIPLPQHL